MNKEPPMQKRTWKAYNKNLVAKEGITFFIDEEVLQATRRLKKIKEDAP